MYPRPLTSPATESPSFPSTPATTTPLASPPATTNITTAPTGPQRTPRPPADLSRIHQQSLSLSAAVATPDAGHLQAEQRQHLRQQAVLKQIRAIEDEIQHGEKILRSHEKDPVAARASGAERKLQVLRREHAALGAELQQCATSAGAARPGSAPDASRLTTTTTTTTTTTNPAATRPHARATGSVPSLTQQSSSSRVSLPSVDSSTEHSDAGDSASSSSATSPRSRSDASTRSDSADSDETGLSDLDELAAAEEHLAALERSLAKLQQASGSPEGVSGSDEVSDSHSASIRELTRQIDTLRTLVNRFPLEDSDIHGHAAQRSSGSNLSTLVRSVTTQRLASSRVAADDGGLPDKHGPADLVRLHNAARDLRVQMPEEALRTAIKGDAQQLDTLEQAMEDTARRGDQAFASYQRLSQAIARDRELGNVGPNTLAAKQGKLQKYENEWLRCSTQVLALMDRWESLQDTPTPAADKSAKQLASERKAFIEQYKSPATRALDKTHADLLAMQTKYVGDHPGRMIMWDALAGAAGFSSSFLIGNTLARFLPGTTGVWLPPLISGSFHVLFATPIVKNVMARNWSATSLAELNNYFRLMGADWGDRLNDETELRKYDPKNPDQAGKLTIGERRAQEKDLPELIANRYRDEEAAYWVYTFNYTMKAVLCGLQSQYMAQGTPEVRAVEAAWHGVMGALSGAEYIISQQLARSTRPGSTPSAVPTREVFAAQQACLKSLREDLDSALSAHREAHGTNPKDPVERALRKESQRIEKERAAAETKARLGGIAMHEFAAQFDGDVKWDTLSEVLGRIITLAPTTVTSYLTASMRKSPDPVLMFLGHFLPSVALIYPFPLPGVGGFTSRPWVCGLIRAGLQAFLTPKTRPAADTTATVMTRLAAAASDTTGAHDHSSTEIRPSDLSSSEVSDGVLSRDETNESYTVEMPDDDDESSIVSQPDSSDSDDAWAGNPTQRDQQAAN